MGKKNILLLMGVVFQINAWNYPPTEQKKMEDFVSSVMRTFQIKNPGDAALVTHELYARYIIGNGVVPSQDAKVNILKGFAKRIARDELNQLDVRSLSKQEWDEVLAAQERSIDNCGTESTLSYYFDREVQRDRLKQGIQGKIQNRASTTQSTQGDCSICFEPRTISPFKCGNKHGKDTDTDTWACQSCQNDIKSKQGVCPFCKARLK